MSTKYVSRRYLREKWEDLKWDMEKIVRVYEEEGPDDVSEEVSGVRINLLDKLNAIKKEIE